MALQVWLPLNGSTIQQGISGITMAGSPSSWGDGKIGKCASFNGSTSNVIYNNTTDFNYTDNFSWTIWVKTNYTGSTAQYIFTNGRADYGGYGYGLQCVSTTNCRCRFGNSTYEITVNGGEWTHLAFTKEGNIVKTYKNGVLWSSYTFGGTLPTYSDGNGLGLGCFHYSSNVYPYYGDINDFRIYNHVLSPREIKEISKGLVLHYPLSRGGFGQDNHYQNSNFSTGATSYWYGVNGSSISVVVKDGKNTITGMKGTGSNIFGQTIDDYSYVANSPITFTISADIYVEESGTLSIGNWITTTQASGWQSMSSTSVVWNKPNTLQVGWNKISVTKKGCTNQYDGKIVTAFGYTGTTFYATNIKFEFGEKQTPWIPNTADVAYINLGFNDGIEYDVSGYCNNGTKSGILTYSSDTPRYNTSTILNGTYITLASLTSSTIPQFSICGWVNLLTGYTANYGCHLINFGKTYCRICVSKDGAAIRILLADESTNYTLSSTMTASNLSADVWNHYAVTFDNGSIKIYINGQLDKSAQATITSISSSASLWSIGNYGTTELPKSKVSDVRIYFTALSADDILELYHTPISLANNGALLTQGEFVES